MGIRSLSGLYNVFQPVEWLQSAKEYVVETVEDYLPTSVKASVQKVHTFAKSEIGKGVVSTVKAVVGETGGMMMGTAFPEAATAYGAYQLAKNTVLSEIEDPSAKETSTTTQMIAQAVGIGAAAATFAVSKGVPAIVGDSFVAPVVVYAMQTLGAAVGGMEGVKLGGGEIASTNSFWDSYLFRTMQYVGATDATAAVQKAMPSLPFPLSVGSFIVGKVAKAVIGSAAYYRKEATNEAIKFYHRKPATVDLYDPGEVLKAGMASASGSTDIFTEGLLKKYLGSVPVVKTIAKRVLGRVIDNNAATNAFVRSVNFYASILQYPTIQKAYKSLLECTDKELRKMWQKQLMNLIKTEIKKQFILGEKGLAWFLELQSKTVIDEIVRDLANTIQENEMKMIGFQLSDSETTKALLEVHTKGLMSLIVIALKRETAAAVMTKSDRLTEKETAQFYQNLPKIFFSHNNRVVQGMEAVIRSLMPIAMKFGNALPSMGIQTASSVARSLVKNEDLAPVPDPKDRFKALIDSLKQTKNRISKMTRFFTSVEKWANSLWRGLVSLFTNKPPPKASKSPAQIEPVKKKSIR